MSQIVRSPLLPLQMTRAKRMTLVLVLQQIRPFSNRLLHPQHLSQCIPRMWMESKQACFLGHKSYTPSTVAVRTRNFQSTHDFATPFSRHWQKFYGSLHFSALWWSYAYSDHMGPQM